MCNPPLSRIAVEVAAEYQPPLHTHTHTCSAPSHYLNQCLIIVNWALIQNFSFMKIHFKMAYAKWRSFCRRGNELIDCQSLTPHVSSLRRSLLLGRSKGGLCSLPASCDDLPGTRVACVTRYSHNRYSALRVTLAVDMTPAVAAVILAVRNVVAGTQCFHAFNISRKMDAIVCSPESCW